MSVGSEEKECRAYSVGMPSNQGREISGEEGSGGAKHDAHRAAVERERISVGGEDMGEVHGSKENDERG